MEEEYLSAPLLTNGTGRMKRICTQFSLLVRISIVTAWYNQIRKIRREFIYNRTMYFEGVNKQLWAMDKGASTTIHRPEETGRNQKKLEERVIQRSHKERNSYFHLRRQPDLGKLQNKSWVKNALNLLFSLPLISCSGSIIGRIFQNPEVKGDLSMYPCWRDRLPSTRKRAKKVEEKMMGDIQHGVPGSVPSFTIYAFIKFANMPHH